VLDDRLIERTEIDAFAGMRGDLYRAQAPHLD
jgi:hypothetical protein